MISWKKWSEMGQNEQIGFAEQTPLNKKFVDEMIELGDVWIFYDYLRPRLNREGYILSDEQIMSLIRHRNRQMAMEAFNFGEIANNKRFKKFRAEVLQRYKQ